VTREAAADPPPLDPATVRGLVFDLDGTLVDSYEAITASLNYARSEFDLPALSLSTVRERVGRGLESLVAELVGPRYVERAVPAFRRRYAEVFDGMTRALPGVVTTLERLHHAGYPMVVATNKPARFAEPILRGLGMLPFLRGVLGPDVSGVTKPDPGMLRQAFRLLDVPAAGAAYVGDMVLDVESAARAEVPVILVAGGSSSSAELRATGQTVLPDLGSLPRLLPDTVPPHGGLQLDRR